MSPRVYRLLAFIFIVIIAVPKYLSASGSVPMRASELVALVAGDALSDNVVRELNARGVTFHPDETLRSELRTAGADVSVLSALEKAKFVGGEATSPSDDELLRGLATAGGLLHEKKYDQAITVLDALLRGGYPGPETGFVMGAILVENGNAEEAVPVYQRLLLAYPNFPELHTKFSYALFRAEHGEDAYKEAQSALSETPQNAEAHKNAGLALATMGKYDAAIVEYREALKTKADYARVWLDLGVAQHAKHDDQTAIETLKRAIVLDSTDYMAHYNLGVVYGETKQSELAIKEYRLAKKIDPTQYEARHNLAASLMDLRDLPSAISEFRQLEADFPDAEVCHNCLAKALKETGDLNAAELEYKKAASLSPDDPEPHLGIGNVLEEKKDPVGAMREYKSALQLDPDSAFAHRAVARLLLNAKRVKQAMPEIELATRLNPSDWYNHALYASVLEADGQVGAALSEYKQAVTLDPSQYPELILYGALLEKSGDWAGALEQFRKAALVDNSNETQTRYSAEQKRFEEYLESLRVAGKGAEAETLRTRVAETRTSTNLSGQMDDAMQRGAQAFAERNQADALLAYKRAVEIGEKIKPHDPRLLLAFQRYGLLQIGLKNSAGAQATFERALVVTAEIYGPDSTQRCDPLGGLASNAMQVGDFETAGKYYAQMMEINRKAFGEQSGEFASSLVAAAMPFVVQKEWDKAEPILLRSERIVEANVSSPDDYHLWTVTSMLCQLYDGWGKPEQSLKWDQRLLAIEIKVVGENSPRLGDVLTSEMKALTALGRTKEAAEVDQRLRALQGGTGQPGSQQ